MNKLWRFTLLLVFSLAVLCSCKDDDEQETNRTDNISREEKILRVKIAQMLMVGFRGTGPELTNEMKEAISEVQVGGVILFEYDAIAQSRPRNIESKTQLSQLIANLKKAANGSLFVAVDQEGGKVCRLKENYGYPRTVTAQYLGDLNNTDTTSLYATSIAQMVSESGFNLNCAPCVDLNVNPLSPDIGAYQRSFSADPEIVTSIASIFYNKQKEKQVLSAFKHFPGHGSATSDSHDGFTDVSQTWSANELEPYKRLIAKGTCDIIMTSHVFNSQLDDEYPATLSAKTINGLLRQQMGFNGVVISDDMAMAAIRDNWDLETSICKAINAGVDILIFSNNQGEYNGHISQQAVDIIANLIRNGKIQKAASTAPISVYSGSRV